MFTMRNSRLDSYIETPFDMIVKDDPTLADVESNSNKFVKQ